MIIHGATYRVISTFSDGTSTVQDIESNDDQYRGVAAYIPVHKLHMAELVVAVSLLTGETKVIKNRFGDEGTVVR
jgi:hypothetical protein